jgi:hypothetical protein
VIGNLHNIDNRRLSILQSSKFCKRFGVDECWGEGLMIFVPFARTQHQQGLKNRFLPLLTDAKLESFFPGSKRPDWKKETMCDLVVQGVKGWVNHHPHYPGEGILDRAFCTWASRCEVGKKIALEEAVEKTRAVWTEQKNANLDATSVTFKTETANTLSRAKSALLFDYKMVGHKRKRRWIPKEDCLY